MANKENFEFEDISSSSNPLYFEDIVSDSKNTIEPNEEYIVLNTLSANRRYKKKRHGIVGFFQAIGDKLSDFWKRQKKWQKATIISLSSIILALTLLVVWVLTFFRYNYNGQFSNNPNDLGFTQVINNNVVNVALFGIDTRSANSFKGNSDSIMILSINTKTKKIKIISVLRDTLSPITKNGKTTYKKINSAYASGGPELAVKTLNEVFKLDISEYATVNFFGMADIIDAVGGIDVELTAKEVQPISKNRSALNACIAEVCAQLKKDPNDYYVLKSGKQHLNGTQAVAYSRIRKTANIWGTNNDYGRTDRQRYVMEQLFNKAITMDKTKYLKLVKALIPCSETSLSYDEILSLAVNVLLESPTFSQDRLPREEYQMRAPSIKGVGSCVYYDLDFAADLIHAFIYDDVTFDEYTKENGITKYDWYRKDVKGPETSGGTTSSKPSTSSNSTTSSKPTTSTNSGTGNNQTSSETTSSEDSSKPNDSDGNESKPDNSGGNQGGVTSGNTGTSDSDETQEDEE